MSTTVIGALVGAGALGVVHAVEPDHVAGISSVTSQYADSRLSALVGACFSLGHVALVVVWLTVGYLLLGRTEFPAAFDAVGTLGVTALLGVLGATMAVNGVRSLSHTHAHDHGDEVHAHSHLHLPSLGPSHDRGSDGNHQDPGDDRDHGSDHDHAVGTHSHGELDSHDGHGGHDADHDRARTDGVIPHAHGHGVSAYLKTGVVGALFTLSPPVTMIVFASRLFPDYGPGVVALAVAAYALGITATMSAVGAGVGAAFGLTAANPRAYGVARILGGVLVVGLAASMVPGVLPVPA